MSDTLPQPFGHIRTDIHGNACEVLGYTTEQLAAAVAMERDRLIAILVLQKASYEREISMGVAAERERCAKVCDAVAVDDMTGYGIAEDCANKIRAG